MQCISYPFLGGRNVVGFVQANIDMFLSHPKYLIYGLSDRKKDIQCAILLINRYSIRCRRIAGCPVIIPEVNYSKSYNFVIRWYYRCKNGRDVILEPEENIFNEADTT